MNLTRTCIEYRKQYPDMPTLTLAKMIYKALDNKPSSIESVRSALKRIEGKNGKAERDKLSKTYGSTYKSEHRPLNPFDDLPKSYAQKRKVVDVKGNAILFLSDIHFPYQDNEALNVALQYGIEHKADTIYLNGDIMDCYQLSSFEKDPRKRGFAKELADVRAFIAILRREFPQANIYYKEGNHEERYWRYMRIKAPELIGVEAFTLPELLHLNLHNVHYINGRSKATIGKLSVFHGHEFGHSTFSPVNVARGLYMRAKANAICGHSHQTSEHTERDVNDKMVTTWSVGCLSELSPDYAPYNKWNHGFAFITRNGADFTVHNKRIHQGRIL